MSEPDDRGETFLRRWSRRKQAAETRAGERNESAETAGSEATPSPDAATPSEPEAPAFDPATLPPIESITATSDVRAFLAPGVPEELSRAALRRAWLTDPTIRDFIGLAENQWDFTQPDSVPGFGSLELTPELRRMVARLVGDAPAQTAPRSEPVVERDGQAADKSRELPPAVTVRATEESDTGVAGALAQGKPQITDKAAAGAPPAGPQAGGSAPAPQPSLHKAAKICGSAHRRHGGAVPD